MQYLVISDIHANRDALQAVLDAAPKQIPIWFLGDAVGYYPDASAVLDMLVGLGDRLQVWLRGNHDEAVLATHVGYFDANPIAKAAIMLTRTQLSADEKSLLMAASVGPLIMPDKPGITVVHAAPDNPLHHYLRDTHNAARAAQACTTPVCLVGHTHEPLKLYSHTPLDMYSWQREPLFKTINNTFHYQEKMVFLNPGSVGQPRDGFASTDQRPYATFALLDTEQCTLQVHRVPYDMEHFAKRTRIWLKDTLPGEMIDKHLLRLLHGV